MPEPTYIPDLVERVFEGAPPFIVETENMRLDYRLLSYQGETWERVAAYNSEGDLQHFGTVTTRREDFGPRHAVRTGNLGVIIVELAARLVEASQ